MHDTTKSVRAAATRVGMFPPPNLLGRGPETARQFLAQAADAGIDYVCCGDHVSFFGIGSDGLVQATVLAMLHPTLPVHIGVYLLPLRHPVLVARQLADFAQLAPDGSSSESAWVAKTATRSRCAESTQRRAASG